MVKELRLAGVSSMAVANAWLPGFITAYNARFGRDPATTKDLHRPLARADDLDEILAWREERTVTRNLTLHHDRMMLILEPTSLARDLVRKKVEMVNYPDGRFAVQFNGATLGFKVFGKIQTVQPGAIVDNKRLSAVLEQVKAQQAAYPARQQRGDGARQRPPKNPEAPGLPSKGRAPRQRGNQTRCSTPLRRCSPSRAARARRERECHLYFARRVTFPSCADTQCRRRIKMSPLCQLEMTLTGGLWGDGLATDDEELSRLEESTAREAVRPLMLRWRPYKRAVRN